MKRKSDFLISSTGEMSRLSCRNSSWLEVKKKKSPLLCSYEHRVSSIRDYLPQCYYQGTHCNPILYGCKLFSSSEQSWLEVL